MTQPTLKKIALALMGTTMIVPAAVAQDGDAPIQSVYERTREDFAALGIRTGSFLFFPKIEADAKFDTNIYKSDEAREAAVDDLIAIIKPSFKLSSDWNNHYFEVNADAKVGRYMDQTDEDYEDFKLGMNGRYDITRGSSISVNASYDDGHEDRGSEEVDNTGADSRYATYKNFKAGIGFKRDEGLFSLALDGKYDNKNYQDAAIAGNVVNNDDRDRQEYRGIARVGYHLNDEYEAFIKFTAVQVEYDDRRDDNGVIHDNDGWDVVGGIAFKLGGKTEGEAYVGYVKRDYDSASLGDLSDVKFGASVLWTPSGLTSVKFAVDRNVNESVTRRKGIPAAGTLSTRFSVRGEHELQRNLLLQANAAFTKLDYINILREDDRYAAGMGAKYLINRNLSMNVKYEFEKRTAFKAAADQDYSAHAFIVSLTSQW